MVHTVLVVEDEAELRELMRVALEMNGFAVVTASEGGEALRALDRIDHLCLVLLDLLMPGMNGWDFLREFQTRSELASVPVVVHTSAPDAAPAGARRVLQKPVEVERLVAIVREYCAG